MKVKGMTLANVIRKPEIGKTRDATAEANVDKGTVVLTCSVGGSPGSRDVSHGSRATSTIGRGSENQSDTSEQHEKSVPTLESCTQSTWWTSQQPWIPWTLPTRRSHWPPPQVIKWHSSDRSMYTRST